MRAASNSSVLPLEARRRLWDSLWAELLAPLDEAGLDAAGAADAARADQPAAADLADTPPAWRRVESASEDADGRG
jgi:hypothetical protein